MDQNKRDSFITALDYVLYNTKKYCFVSEEFEQFTIILDLTKCNLDSDEPDMFFFIKTINYFLENFPECLDRLLVVEAGKCFFYLWQLIQSDVLFYFFCFSN